MGRIVALVLGSGLIGVAGNALSPAGLAWNTRWTDDLRMRTARAGIEPVGLEDVRRAVRDGTSLLIDARADAWHRLGHLPGARSLSAFVVRTSGADALPHERPLIVYCESRWCDAGLFVAARLRESGHARVALFIDGYEAWLAAGGAVERD